MVARRHLIHPDLLQNLADFYPQRGTIQAATSPQDQYGQPIKQWTDLAGVVDVPCRVSPVSVSETDTTEQTYGTITHRIALRGAYPEIDERMRIVVSGQAYDIQGVQTDPQQRSTYLDTEIVR